MSIGNDKNPRNNTFIVDISEDTDLSLPMYKGHLDICGVRIPSNFDGTTLTFLESETEDGTYQTVQWEGSDLTLTVAASKTAMFDPAKLSGLKWLKISTGTVQSTTDTIVEPIYRDFT